MTAVQYADEILEGDIHTSNMKAFGLNDRSQAKVAIYGYAWCYNGWRPKLGSIIGKGAEGRALRDSSSQLILHFPSSCVREEAVQERPYLSASDGRRLPVQ